MAALVEEFLDDEYLAEVRAVFNSFEVTWCQSKSCPNPRVETGNLVIPCGVCSLTKDPLTLRRFCVGLDCSQSCNSCTRGTICRECQQNYSILKEELRGLELGLPSDPLECCHCEDFVCPNHRNYCDEPSCHPKHFYCPHCVTKCSSQKKSSSAFQPCNRVICHYVTSGNHRCRHCAEQQDGRIGTVFHEECGRKCGHNETGSDSLGATDY